MLLFLNTGCEDLKKDFTYEKTEDINLGTNPPSKEDIPDVQVLVPGFSVKELPLDLTNINVVRYGPDERLYALAYDGRIYVLTDTDGDGVEDKAEYWWEKDPLVSPVGMVVAEEGMYVTSLNKVSLLKDKDNDGKAETEQIITSEWVSPSRYTGTSSGGVDAMGIAKDKNGNLFFALGTANFINPYLVDSLGQSQYDINSQRGTILKLYPENGKREIFATGTRFPVALAFNEEGDLFASEQEGATWLPNGNPYDELLHIKKSRHYGFPPRHPEYLPDVIDEPSVYDYKPQHQSTTGLNFNFPVKGTSFGPDWWVGDAFLTGYSRGKIYRTKLVKTRSGYIAQNSIFASVTSLAVDACTSPDGNLVLATHSGFPDWGYGPEAKGKLYKVMYTKPDTPNPVAIWASKRDQVKIAFDKPIGEEYLSNLADEIEIEYGVYVEAGDRFEVLRPGYQAAERQLSFPREPLRVKNAEISEDGHTLKLNTLTHTSPVTYAIKLPAFSSGKENRNSIAQNPAIDLSYKLNGVEVKWQAKSESEKWEGWIPHLDLNVSKELMTPVKEYNDFKKLLTRPGKVTFQAKLDLWNMLRPDVQPESSLEYELPPEDVSLKFRSTEKLEIMAPEADISGPLKKGEYYETKVEFKEVAEKAYEIEISMETGNKEPELELSYSTNEDKRSRALQLHRFSLPWLEDISANVITPERNNPKLAGGNWSRGENLFYGEAMCANCHSIGGKGKAIGPELSNLIYRDYESVFRDISEPSAAINPDFVGHKVSLKDGSQLTGMISYKKDSMIIEDIAGNKRALSLEEVENTTPMSSSLMPPGLDKALGEQKMKDLMTYLLTSLKPAEYSRNFGVPQRRNASEVNAILGKNGNDEKNTGPADLKILWVSGPKDHGPDEHDYPLQQKRYTELLSLVDNVEITNASEWPTPDQFEEADVVVFYWRYPDFSEEDGKQLDKFLQRGGGLVYIHYAVDATANPQALADRIGYAWKRRSSKFRHGMVDLDFEKNDHPITEGFDKITFKDESYWNLVKGKKEVNVLATAEEDGKARPMIWTATQGKGRIFVSIPGHYNWTFDDPLFRIILLRGIAWSGSQPTDRFNNIIKMGARLSQ